MEASIYANGFEAHMTTDLHTAIVVAFVLIAWAAWVRP
jgi:hypothetical protein